MILPSKDSIFVPIFKNKNPIQRFRICISYFALLAYSEVLFIFTNIRFPRIFHYKLEK